MIQRYDYEELEQMTKEELIDLYLQLKQEAIQIESDRDMYYELKEEWQSYDEDNF